MCREKNLTRDWEKFCKRTLGLSTAITKERWKCGCKLATRFFLLDFPLEICLAGVESRIGKPREDMPWVETEFDAEFKQWILDFPTKQLPQIYALLEKYKENKEIIIFKSRNEADAYLENCKEC